MWEKNLLNKNFNGFFEKIAFKNGFYFEIKIHYFTL